MAARHGGSATKRLPRRSAGAGRRPTRDWSLRGMAGATGYAPSTIHRIWQAFGLQPHRAESFKLSRSTSIDGLNTECGEPLRELGFAKSDGDADWRRSAGEPTVASGRTGYNPSDDD